MNEKEKFEDIIASKFSEAEFPFDEANWDAAEEMIDAQRIKEKRRRIGFIFLSGILLGVAAMLPFVKLNDTPKTKIAESITPTVEAAKVENTQKNITAETAVEKLTSQPENSIPEVVENKVSSVSTIAVNAPIKSEPIKIKSTRNRPSNSIVNTNDLIKEDIGNLVSNHPTVNKTDNNLHLNTPLEAVNESGLSFLTKLENNVEIVKDSIPDFTVLGTPEKLANFGKEYHPWNVSASIGGNYVNHFSLNPIQGIEISRSITPHFEIGTGAYYTYLTIGSGAVKSITTSANYDFGYQRDVTEIKTNKLHYAVIPIYAKYNLNDNNSFVLGANIYALFTSSNSVTTYKEVYGEKQGAVAKKASGYSSGINSFDLGLLAGYKRNLFGNLGAAVYFNYGLNDIKKNAYYNSSKFERNVSGQFMLTYKL